MANITQTLAAVRQGQSNSQIARALHNCDGVPSPATIRQFVSDILGNPGLALAVPKQHALQLLEQFAFQRGPIRFTHLQRCRVAMQLIARVLHPGLVNQGAFGMCGPAAVAIDTALHNPIEYVTFAISLAETGRGAIGTRMIIPVPSILDYVLAERTNLGMPQADWIVLASLRDDSASLENSFSMETYGGATGDEVFEWMVNCGFCKVVLLSHVTLGHSFRTHPTDLMPPQMATSDKYKSLQTASDMLNRGWRMFMQGFMQLSRSIETYRNIQEMEQQLGPAGAGTVAEGRAAEQTKLEVSNPGAFGTIWNFATGLIGFGGGDPKHWTYVESLIIHAAPPGSVTITCCNHGTRYPAVTLPLEGFLNKFLGFLAVTDYA